MTSICVLVQPLVNCDQATFQPSLGWTEDIKMLFTARNDFFFPHSSSNFWVFYSWVFSSGKVTWTYIVDLHTIPGSLVFSDPPWWSRGQVLAWSLWDWGAQPQSSRPWTPQNNGLDLGSLMEIETDSFPLCYMGIKNISLSPPRIASHGQFIK